MIFNTRLNKHGGEVKSRKHRAVFETFEDIYISFFINPLFQFDLSWKNSTERY